MNKKILTTLILINHSWVMAETHFVSVSSNAFTPRDIVIKAGDTIQWNNTGGSHNVFANDGRFRCAQGCEALGGDGDPSAELWMSEVTFHSVETLGYICQPHIGFGMQGSVTVQTPDNVAASVTVSIENQFEPLQAIVTEGQTVMFENLGGEHNLVFDQTAVSCSVGCSDDGTNLQNSATGFPWVIYRIFDTPGEHTFHCQTHGDEGVIVVLPDLIFNSGFDDQ